jgi:hypothetical protein
MHYYSGNAPDPYARYARSNLGRFTGHPRGFRAGIVSRPYHEHFLLNPFKLSYHYTIQLDRLCGLVVRVPGYRSRSAGFHSRRYQTFWEVVGLERGPLSLVRIIEELLEWKSSGSGLENWINGRGDPFRWPRDTLYPQKLALTSPTNGGRSVGIVRLWTKKSHGVFSYTIQLYTV